MIEGWNADQIRHLEYALTDSLPNVSGLEVCSITDQHDGSWRVYYKYEVTADANPIERQGADYFTGHQTEEGFEDFQIL